VENLCPRSEPVQAVLDRWLAVVATAGADVVMWDEPRGRCCDVWPLLTALLEDARTRSLENAVCLAPDHRWPTANVLRGVTRLGVDPYWIPHHRADRREFAAYWLQRAAALAETVEASLHVWIQGFRVSADAEVEVAEMLAWAAERRIPEIAIWGYRGCASMSVLACERPIELWQTVTTALDARASRPGAAEAAARRQSALEGGGFISEAGVQPLPAG
jgi:hypothetical protein